MAWVFDEILFLGRLKALKILFMLMLVVPYCERILLPLPFLLSSLALRLSLHYSFCSCPHVSSCFFSSSEPSVTVLFEVDGTACINGNGTFNETTFAIK